MREGCSSAQLGREPLLEHKRAAGALVTPEMHNACVVVCCSVPSKKKKCDLAQVSVECLTQVSHKSHTSLTQVSHKSHT